MAKGKNDAQKKGTSRGSSRKSKGSNAPKYKEKTEYQRTRDAEKGKKARKHHRNPLTVTRGF